MLWALPDFAHRIALPGSLVISRLRQGFREKQCSRECVRKVFALILTSQVRGIDMRKLVGHPELEVLQPGVQIEEDERHLILGKQDVERVLVVFLFTPEHRHNDSTIASKLTNEVLIG
jgi:hypothetical protein